MPRDGVSTTKKMRQRQRCFGKVVRTNRWHSVHVQVRLAESFNGRRDREIRMAADQDQRWNGTYLTPKAARALAKLLLRAADAAEPTP